MTDKKTDKKTDEQYVDGKHGKRSRQSQEERRKAEMAYPENVPEDHAVATVLAVAGYMCANGYWVS